MKCAVMHSTLQIFKDPFQTLSRSEPQISDPRPWTLKQNSSGREPSEEYIANFPQRIPQRIPQSTMHFEGVNTEEMNIPDCQSASATEIQKRFTTAWEHWQVVESWRVANRTVKDQLITCTVRTASVGKTEAEAWGEQDRQSATARRRGSGCFFCWWRGRCPDSTRPAPPTEETSRWREGPDDPDGFKRREELSAPTVWLLVVLSRTRSPCSEESIPDIFERCTSLL